MADQMGIAQAQAVGGPAAAAEFANAKAGTTNATQQALSQMSANAGAAGAPAAFAQHQAALFAPTLNAQGAALGADAGAAGAYSGALQGAMGDYAANANSPQVHAAEELQARLAALGAQRQDVVDLHRYYSALNSGQTQNAAASNRMLAAQKQQALDNAATMLSGQKISSDNYDNFKDVLAKSKDLPTAVSYLNNTLKSSIATDNKGNPIPGPDGKLIYNDAKGNPLKDANGNSTVDPDLIKSMLLSAYGTTPEFNQDVAKYGVDTALYLNNGNYGGLAQQGSDNPNDILASLIQGLSSQ